MTAGAAGVTGHDAAGHELEFPCATRLDYEAALQEPAMTVAWQLEQDLVQRRPTRASWLPGFCAICAAPTRFRVPGTLRRRRFAQSGLRDELTCRSCGLAARQRKIASLLRSQAPGRRLYVTEQRGPFFAHLRRTWQGALLGSEYLGPNHAPGAHVGDTRHEDLQRLSFPDGSFDLAASCDVLEHVVRPELALRELRRVLAPGGTLLFTVPFHGDLQDNRVRAVVEDGRVRHLLPPEHHGDPLSRRGALVFTDFGWQLLDQLRDAGFAEVRVVLHWSLVHGYLGVPCQYFVAT